MGNIWDLPEQKPTRKRGKRTIRREEPDMADATNKLMKTTSDFMLGAAGIVVISKMGGAVLSSLSK